MHIPHQVRTLTSLSAQTHTVPSPGAFPAPLATQVYSTKAYDKLPFHIGDSLQLAKLTGAGRVLDLGSVPYPYLLYASLSVSEPESGQGNQQPAALRHPQYPTRRLYLRMPIPFLPTLGLRSTQRPYRRIRCEEAGGPRP